MIQNIINYITEISQGNEMVAGALTLAASGAASWVFLTLPRSLLSFIKRQFITTMVFNNAESHDLNAWIKLNEFISSKVKEDWSRTLYLSAGFRDDEYNIRLTTGYGTHIFLYKGKLMWMTKSKLDSSGSEKLKEEVSISYFGRTHKFFKDIEKENKYEPVKGQLEFYQFGTFGWDLSSSSNKRGLDSLAQSKGVVETIKKDFDYFFENKEEYARLNLPYKMTYILHGSTGNGKSSLIRALASDYNLKVCPLNVNTMGDTKFQSAVTNAPKNSLIVIEDFDSSSAFKKRNGITMDDGVISNDVDEDSNENSLAGLSLSGILNTLDGVASLDNKIIILTTNCLSTIDPAVLRAGRVDRIVEIPRLTQQEISEYLEKLTGVVFDDLPELFGKDINNLLYSTKGDTEKMKIWLDEYRGKDL